MNSYIEIRAGVLEELRGLLEEREKQLQITDEMNLNSDVGLSSLDLAGLVAVLDRRFGVDPFRKEVGITSVRTIADLCAAYAGVSHRQAQKDNNLLTEAIKRAEGRRE